MYRSRGLSQTMGSRMNSFGVRRETSQSSSLLSISEKEGRLDRQSVSLLGPGRQQCDFFSNPLFCKLQGSSVEWCSIYIFLQRSKNVGSGADYHESAGESESILFFIAWGVEGRYLFSVCGSRLGILCFVVCIIISLIIWFCMSVYMMCVVVCMIQSCQGRKALGGPGQSSDIEPGEHDEQGQGFS